MNQLTNAVIRFRHAADAIGLPKKTLRNWISRESVILSANSDGWKRFTPIDLAALTMTAELVKYGVGIVPAFVSARNYVNARTNMLQVFGNTPLQALAPAFQGEYFLGRCIEPGKWEFNHRPAHNDPLADAQGPSFLLIDMHRLISDMLIRLADSLEVDPIESDD